MTDEQINIAIAESLGRRNIWQDDRGNLRGYHPQYEADGMKRLIPNYTASLDACAEFEAKLDSCDADTQLFWMYHLALVCGWPEARNHAEALFESHYRSIRATAAQRCEAYLRTVGEWKESNQQPE